MTIKFNPLIILFFLTSCGGGSGSLDINQNDDPISLLKTIKATNNNPIK